MNFFVNIFVKFFFNFISVSAFQGTFFLGLCYIYSVMCQVIDIEASTRTIL